MTDHTGPTEFFRRSRVVFRRLVSPELAAAELLFLFLLPPFYFRSLWFDEALTILNFALLGSVRAIYHSYVIPNNQIVHTILLSWWIEYSGFAMLRLFPVLCTMVTLALLSRFRGALGRTATAAVMLALAVSTPFLICGTALRGYMLAALFALLALCCALNFARRGRFTDALGYFLCSFFGVGTMPGTLAALAGAALYAAPCCGKRFYRSWRFYLLGIIPLVAFGCFYGPIWPQLMRCAALGEGWPDGGNMLKSLYFAAAVSFVLLLIPGIAGAWTASAHDRWKRKRLFFFRLLIFLLPIPAAFCFKVAPFPRVFFPLLPIWVLLCGGGLRHLAAYLRKKRGKFCGRRIGRLYLAGIVVCGALFQAPALRERFCDCCGGAGRDDFFFPHYLRADFMPEATAEEIGRRYPQTVPPVFISFASDPWALMFATANRTAMPHVFFDGPRGRVGAMPYGSLLVIRAGETPETWEARFSLRAEPLFANAMHKVYLLK